MGIFSKVSTSIKGPVYMSDKSLEERCSIVKNFQTHLKLCFNYEFIRIMVREGHIYEELRKFLDVFKICSNCTSN